MILYDVTNTRLEGISAKNPKANMGKINQSATIAGRWSPVWLSMKQAPVYSRLGIDGKHACPAWKFIMKSS